MFETGARISEILELTVGDYRKRSDIHELSATNKGRFKQRIKFICVHYDLPSISVYILTFMKLFILYYFIIMIILTY